MWPLDHAYPERRPHEVDTQEYDYVVIGGGTAGCVVASRLSEDPCVTVLVLERGPAEDTWISRVPLASSNILNPKSVAKRFLCEPLEHCGGRQSFLFYGQALGGTSRVNSMAYTRSSVADYEAWSEMGHPEWCYEKVLPYFIKSETSINQPEGTIHGTSGPWITRNGGMDWSFRAYTVLHKCAQAMGFPVFKDVHAHDAASDGLSTLDFTINGKKQRVSTLDAFLPRSLAAARKKTLTICTGTIVSQIVFSDEKQTTCAERVMFQDAKKSGIFFSVKVKREVIVCSGALGSPQILMLSGIGPKEHLEEHNIKVEKHLPGVGSNLSDHLGIPIGWEVPMPESAHHVATSPLKAAREFFKYVFCGAGILSMPISCFSVLLRSTSLDTETAEFLKEKALDVSPNAQGNIPDIELMPLALSSADDLDAFETYFSKVGVFSILASLLQPKSRGSVRLRSSNPHDFPKVDLGMLSAPEDMIVARLAVRLALRLGAAMQSAGFPLLKEIMLPENVGAGGEVGDVELDAFIKKQIRTGYHYSSSCRMAMEKDGGVVNDELKVYGVQNLTVCDASVFPRIPSGHLQAPVVMAAEKCADMIKARWKM